MALWLPKKKAVPIDVKESIMAMGYLVGHINGDPDADASLSDGWSTLQLE
jgi:hypothetical protein